MSISFNPAGKSVGLWLLVAAFFAATFCISIAAVLDSTHQDAAHSVANIGEGWSRIETKDFTVYYEEGVDLNAMARRLRKKIFFFGQGPSYDEGAEKNITYRLDSLFSRASEILDMYPQIPKLKIKIFKNEDELYDVYQKLIGNRGWTKAFYVHFYRTIFTSEETINDSVMAHEIAHAIIDHFYKSVPPPKVSEALASYIDMHVAD